MRKRKKIQEVLLPELEPQNRIFSLRITIHIAGTRGKGSTTTIQVVMVLL